MHSFEIINWSSSSCSKLNFNMHDLSSYKECAESLFFFFPYILKLQLIPGKFSLIPAPSDTSSSFMVTAEREGTKGMLDPGLCWH